MDSGAPVRSPKAGQDDDLPLHPTTARWVRAYADADPINHDAIVARILEEMNAVLWQRDSASSPA